MAQMVNQLDPALVFLVLLPLGLAIAAWALQMACAVSDVEPPDYWQSLLCIVLIVVANVVLRFWVNISVPHPGLGYHVLWPLGMTSAIVAVMVRTGPMSAIVVTVCEGALCAGLYLGFSMAGSAVLTVL
jgi:hypothetical protein